MKRVLSIIVPIYNVEKYLKKCIDSLINQIKNEEDVEVLLIDDGSTDNSIEICDIYADKYSYIQVYHKKNGGLSDARNFGIRKSSGDYLIFIDSDDYVDLKLVSEVKKNINKNPDIILWDARYVNEDDVEINNIKYKMKHVALKKDEIYSGKMVLENSFEKVKELPTAVWLGAYKRSFIEDEVLFFEKGLLHEDEMWTLKVIFEAQSIIYINQDLYCYRIRENSIMRNNDKNKRHIEAYVYIYNSLIEYFNLKVKDKNLLELIMDNLMKRYLHALSMWEAYKYKETLKRISKKNIIKYSKSKKNKLRAYVFGLNRYIYCYYFRKK